MKKLIIAGCLFFICLVAIQPVKAQYYGYGYSSMDYNPYASTWTLNADFYMDYYYMYSATQGIYVTVFKPDGSVLLQRSEQGGIPVEIPNATFAAEGCGTYRVYTRRWQFLRYNVYNYYWNGNYVSGFYDPVSGYTNQETLNAYYRSLTLTGYPPDAVRSDTFRTLDESDTYYDFPCEDPPAGDIIFNSVSSSNNNQSANFSPAPGNYIADLDLSGGTEACGENRQSFTLTVNFTLPYDAENIFYDIRTGVSDNAATQQFQYQSFNFQDVSFLTKTGKMVIQVYRPRPNYPSNKLKVYIAGGRTNGSYLGGASINLICP